MSSYFHKVFSSQLTQSTVVVAILLICAGSTFAQGLSGPTSVTVNETVDYVYTDDVQLSNTSWSVTGGSVTNYWQSGTNYYVTVYWNTVGTGKVEFFNGPTLLGSMNVSVGSASGPPDTPIANNAISIGSTYFTANWNNVTGAESYRLDVATSNSFGGTILSAYNNVLVTPNNLQVLSLAMGTTYYYRVRAVNSYGTSGNSNIISATTQCIQPTTATAGPDQTGSSTCGLTTVALAGNTPSIGTGAWTIISGSGGSITNSASPTSNFSGTAGNNYTLRWTTSTSCASTTDDVVITFNQNPTAANAGPDQTSSATCGLTNVTLAGNSPSIGTGAWSILSGSGGSFGNSSSSTSTFSGTAGTTYTLRWTISNSPCTASIDDVIVTFNRNPTAANAGSDQTGVATCGLTSITLAGNSPSIGAGTWSIVSGSGGSFGNSSSPTSTFSGTTGSTYTLRWTISNNPCTASTDDVVITFSQNPTTANAGPDQTGATTCNLTTVTLAGNTPSIGTGAWSIISGSGGSFTNSSSSTSSFSGTAGTTYTLRWTITNSPCVSTDDVIITFNRNPTTANAGTDKTNSATCGLSSVTMTGNNPSIGTGIWSIVSGSGGSFANSSSPTSTFSGTVGTTYTLRWTINSSPCTASTDDVVVTFNRNPTTASAGSDQTGVATCGLTSITLAGNSPSIGTGTWSIVSGTGGSIANLSSPTSSFTGVAGSTYTLRWTIGNSPCTASTDDVVIIFNRNPTAANAGPDQNDALTCGLTTVTLAGNVPNIGTGAWSIVGGSGGAFGDSSSPTSTFTGTAGMGYTLRWTISNSPCTASLDNLNVLFNLNPTSDAGMDQTLCGMGNVNLSANNPATGTGIWSIVSGPSLSISQFSNEYDRVAVFSPDGGPGSYVLQWSVSNFACPVASDLVTITVGGQPTANAGPDLSNPCSSIELAAFNPALGTGSWSVASGTGGYFIDTANPATTFNGLPGTSYILRWTVSSGSCSAYDDANVVLTANPSGPYGPTGPAIVEIGETRTYTYTTDAEYDENWIVTNASILQSYISGATYKVDLLFNTGDGNATIAFRDGTTTLGSYCIQVNSTPPPTPVTAYNIDYNCGNTVVTRASGPPYEANYDWWWQTSSNGESLSLGYGQTITRTTSSGLWLRARQKNPPYKWSVQDLYLQFVDVFTTPPPPPTVANHSTRFGSGELTLSVNAVTDVFSYRWYKNGVLVSEQPTNIYSPILNSTTTFYVSTRKGCESNQLPVTGTILPQPSINPLGCNGTAISLGQSVTLITTTAYTTYSWRNSNNEELGTSSTFTTSTPGVYTLQVTLAGVVNTGTASVTVTRGLLGQNMNYMVANTMQVDNITDPNVIELLPVESNAQSVQYFDGLGRPIQSVVTQGSPLKYDVVQPFVYDEYGRELNKYLPYVSCGSNGWYKANALDINGNYTGSPHNLFYTAGSQVAIDQAPFAATVFEPSPLNRVLKQGSPGTTWQPNADPNSLADNTVKKRYEFNGSDDVLLWTYDAQTQKATARNGSGVLQYYAVNQLYANKTYDEANHAVMEYVDKQGRTILKRVQADDTVTPTYANTYYIYDDFGNLVIVLPPEAVKALTN